MSDLYVNLREALSNVEFHDDGTTKRQVYDPKQWEIAANPEILRALLAERDRLREALEYLIEKADDSDGCQYGTLSTTFVRDTARAALSGESK